MQFSWTTLQPPTSLTHHQHPVRGVMAGVCVPHALLALRNSPSSDWQSAGSVWVILPLPSREISPWAPTDPPPSPLPPWAKWVFWWLSTRKLVPVCVGRHLWWTRTSIRWDPSDYCEVELHLSIAEGSVCQSSMPFISLPSPRWCYSDYGRPHHFLPPAPVGPNPH